jgi:pimeloyl-ACP methyl ester carboxylesterase
MRLLFFLFLLAPGSLNAMNGVYSPAPGLELRYVVHTPPSEKKKKWPVWIYQDGDGAVARPFSAIQARAATRLLALAHGVAVVWPELRREKLSSSPQRYCELDFFHRVSDTRVLIDTIKRLPFIDTDKIFLVGVSAGSEVVTLAASGRWDVAGVVTFGGGVLSLGDYLQETGELSSARPLTKNTCRPGHYLERSGEFWSQLLDSGLTEALRATPVPTLVLVGEKDPITRCDVTAPFARQLSAMNPKVAFECVAGMGHGPGWARYWRWNRVRKFTESLTNPSLFRR